MFVPVWMWHMVLQCHQVPFGNAQELGVGGLPRDSYIRDLVGVKTNLILMEQHFPHYSLWLALCIDGVLHPSWAGPSLGERYLPEGSSTLCSWNFAFSLPLLRHLKHSPPGLCLITGSKDKGLKKQEDKSSMCLLPLAQSHVHSPDAGGTVKGDVRTSVSTQSPFPGGTSQLTSSILSSFPQYHLIFFSFQQHFFNFFSMHSPSSKVPKKCP